MCYECRDREFKQIEIEACYDTEVRIQKDDNEIDVYFDDTRATFQKRELEAFIEGLWKAYKTLSENED